MPKPKSAAWTTWEDMPLDEFRARAEKARAKAAAFVAEIDELFPGLVTLTVEQRKTAPRLRDGEHAMLHRVLDITEKKPALFESLADEDDGMNPGTFEAPLLRERIEKHKLFLELGDTLDPLRSKVSDSTLYVAGRFRTAISAAYQIAKAHAKTDRGINDVLAPVIDFMRKNAITGAAARTSRKDEPK